MDITAQLEGVVTLFGRLGMDVRREHLGGDSGGLCVIRGRRVVFVDLDADLATRLDRCLQVLAGLPELDTVYVPPGLRERIEQART